MEIFLVGDIYESPPFFGWVFGADSNPPRRAPAEIFLAAAGRDGVRL